MKFFWIPLLCFVFSEVLCQNDFGKIDRHVHKIPKEKNHNIPTLVAYLIQPANTDEEKIRSIYTWIIKNIKYKDSRPENELKFNLTEEYLLTSKSMVCSGFARLFNLMCHAAEIRSSEISGYVKQDSRPEAPNHAWNAVYIDKKWKFVDATWGQTLGDKYFLADAEEMILTHLPAQKWWQLSHYPISLHSFYGKTKEKDSTFYDFHSALQSYFSKNKVDKNLLETKEAFEFNATVTNQKLYVGAMMDKVAEISDSLESVLIKSNIETKKSRYEEMIALCKTSFLTPDIMHTWHKEMYIGLLVNYAVFLYNHKLFDHKEKLKLIIQEAEAIIEKTETHTTQFKPQK